MASQIVDEAAPRGDVSSTVQSQGARSITFTDEQAAALKACDFLAMPNSIAATQLFPASACIPLAGGNLVCFGISSEEVGADTMRRIALALFRSATALNHVVTLRGDNENDTPSTMEHALQGINFLLAWGNALAGAADSGLYVEGE